MNKEQVRQLENNFKTHIIPLLSDKDSDAYQFTWEFEKFLYAKTLQATQPRKTA